MKYWSIRGSVMKWISYAALAGAMACIYFGNAYFSLLLLMFSFHLSNESELCTLRSVVAGLIVNQKAMAGIDVEKTTEQ